MAKKKKSVETATNREQTATDGEADSIVKSGNAQIEKVEPKCFKTEALLVRRETGKGHTYADVFREVANAAPNRIAKQCTDLGPGTC